MWDSRRKWFDLSAVGLVQQITDRASVVDTLVDHRQDRSGNFQLRVDLATQLADCMQKPLLPFAKRYCTGDVFSVSRHYLKTFSWLTALTSETARCWWEWGSRLPHGEESLVWGLACPWEPRRAGPSGSRSARPTVSNRCWPLTSPADRSPPEARSFPLWQGNAKADHDRGLPMPPFWLAMASIVVLILSLFGEYAYG